jgi:hypothetical protein
LKKSTLCRCLAVCVLFFSTSASAQIKLSVAFATQAEAKKVLETLDDYVSNTSPLERAVRMRGQLKGGSLELDTAAFSQFLASTALPWSERDRAKFLPSVNRVVSYFETMPWIKPMKVLLVRANAQLEDNLPHTRANAIVLPDATMALPPEEIDSLIAHEMVHVVMRAHRKIQLASYEVFGFEQCKTVSLSNYWKERRVTNPDAPKHEHTIAVRYQNRDVYAFPYLALAPDQVDGQRGLMQLMAPLWLIADRKDRDCQVVDSTAPSTQAALPREFEGLFEKIGKNTEYLFHPEEILAENIVLLYNLHATKMPLDSEKTARIIPSIQVLKRLNAVLSKFE